MRIKTTHGTVVLIAAVLMAGSCDAADQPLAPESAPTAMQASYVTSTQEIVGMAEEGNDSSTATSSVVAGEGGVGTLGSGN